MLVVTMLEEPKDDTNRKRGCDQQRSSAKKTDGKDITYDWPPADTRIRCYRNAEARAVEGCVKSTMRCRGPVTVRAATAASKEPVATPSVRPFKVVSWNR